MAPSLSAISWLSVSWVSFRLKGSLISTLAPNGLTNSGDIDLGHGLSHGIDLKSGVGLKTGHGRTAVVQNHQGDIGFVVHGIDQGRHDGMIEGRIAAHGQHRLIQAELAQLAETAGHAGTRSHGVHGFKGPESRGSQGHGIAADVAADKTFAVVHLEGIMDTPEGGPVRTAGAEGLLSGRHLGKIKELGLLLILLGHALIIDPHDFAQGGDDKIRIHLSGHGNVCRCSCRKRSWPRFPWPVRRQ